MRAWSTYYTVSISLFGYCNGSATALKTNAAHKELPDDNRVLEPPDPIPNSVVKRDIADGSVGLPHVRVGHRQASNTKKAISYEMAFFFNASS